MELNDIISMGAGALKDKIGGDADSSVITDALSGLFSNEEGGFDLGNIISSVTSGEEGGIGSIVSSWLGDGENAGVDASQITELLGSDKISAFAEKLGIDTDTALSGLTDAVPNIVDKASEGGSLMGSLLGAVTGGLGDSLGDIASSVTDMAGDVAGGATDGAKSGAGGIMGIIGKLFGK